MTNGARILMGASEDFCEGLITARNIDGTELIVVRLHGDLLCFRDRCAHQPVKLSEFGELKGGVLVCHAHGGGFDLARGGRAVCGPPKEPLTPFRCLEENGQVFVIIDK